MPTLAHWQNLYSGAPILFYSFLYQLHMPSIIEHVENKRRLWVIPFLVLLTSLGFYLILGLIVPLAITNVNEMFTHDYRNYSAGLEQAGKPAWTDLISYLVVLSPCMLIFSSFPIYAVSVSNAVSTFFLGVGNEQTHKKMDIYSLRWFTVVIPIVVTFFFYDLKFIIDYVRLLGYLLIPVFIPIMHVASRVIIETPSQFDAKCAPRVISI